MAKLTFQNCEPVNLLRMKEKTVFENFKKMSQLLFRLIKSISGLTN